MTGVAKNTVLKLLADLGSACLDYQETTLRNLTLRYIECRRDMGVLLRQREETSPWSTRASLATGMYGRGRPLMPIRNLYLAWHVGGRGGRDAWDFIANLRSRLANRVQLTTDGHKAYLEAIEGAFGGEVELCHVEPRYTGTRHAKVNGDIVRLSASGQRLGLLLESQISPMCPTSYVERQNLTMRMSMEALYKAHQWVQQEGGEPHACH